MLTLGRFIICTKSEWEKQGERQGYHWHKNPPKKPKDAPSSSPTASDAAAAPATLGCGPLAAPFLGISTPDADFIRRGREQWGPIKRPWPEDQGVKP
jgi:hypothetical protein